MASSAAAASPARTRNAANDQSRPSSRKAALNITGDSECATGSPITPATRLGTAMDGRPPQQRDDQHRLRRGPLRGAVATRAQAHGWAGVSHPVQGSRPFDRAAATFLLWSARLVAKAW